MTPDAAKKRLAREALRRREQAYPVQRDNILKEVIIAAGGLDQEQMDLAKELIQSPIIDTVPIEELVKMVTRGGRAAHA